MQGTGETQGAAIDLHGKITPVVEWKEQAAYGVSAWDWELPVTPSYTDTVV